MEKNEGNKLIAEFMGIKKDRLGDFYHVPFKRSFQSFLPAKMKYNSSWDWLMPVVDKIENDFNGFVLIHNSKCVINPGNLVNIGDSKINAVWKAVTEFINLQNPSP